MLNKTVVYQNSTINKENSSKPRPGNLQTTPTNAYYFNHMPYFPSSTTTNARSPFSLKQIPQTVNTSVFDPGSNKNSNRMDVSQIIGPTPIKEDNFKQKLAEKTKECEEWKKKLCDERVANKISKKKIENYEKQIKELLTENEKLNRSLTTKIDINRLSLNENENRETVKQKDLEARVKALASENDRLFKENEALLSEVQEMKGESMRGVTQREIFIKERDDALIALRNVEGQLEQYKAKSKELENELLQSHVCINDLEKRLKTLLSQNQDISNLNSSCLNASRREDEIKGLKNVLVRYKEEGTKMREIIEIRRKEMEIIKKELERVKRENRKLLKMRIEWEEMMDKERKEKDEYKDLIENQSVILREKELELDEKLLELDEIKKGFLDFSGTK